MRLDKDLESIQAVRDAIRNAKDAEMRLAALNQLQVDQICAAVAAKVAANARYLAEMAVEETGFGVVEDKVLKNLLGSTVCWEYIRPLKTCGIIAQHKEKGIIEIGTPVGIIAGILPSTNPTSTAVYKALISLKARNAIIMSPHPGAIRCIAETVRLIREAAVEAGAPENAVQCLSLVTMPAVSELIRSKDIGLILATGGEAMVRAAYSSGNPALGVGPGNGPAFIERTANVALAVERIFESKTFDNGTICASEQSIVTEACIAEAVETEAVRQNGYFLSDEESAVLARLLLRPNGTINPQVVGKSAVAIAGLAGIDVPPQTRVLISRQHSVGRTNPYSREKLCPVLGFYVEENWERACDRCIELLTNEGAGHTMVIHSENEAVIQEFALKKPVSRLLVNTPAALGGVGATTSLPPALTLGCGAVGKSATSDNVTPLNLINIRRVAYGTKTLADLSRPADNIQPHRRNVPAAGEAGGQEHLTITKQDVERIAREVLARIRSAQH